MGGAQRSGGQMGTVGPETRNSQIFALPQMRDFGSALGAPAQQSTQFSQGGGFNTAASQGQAGMAQGFQGASGTMANPNMGGIRGFGNATINTLGSPGGNVAGGGAQSPVSVGDFMRPSPNAGSAGQQPL
jgi:hypothetical protein